MAKYIGSLTTDIRGKLGGVVFSMHKGQTTIRAKGIPIAPSGGSTPTPINTFANATQAWYAMTGSNNIGWTEFSAYVYFLAGTNPDLLEMNTFQTFSAAFAIGQTIGVFPVPFPVSQPFPPPSATFATLTWDGTTLTASAFAGASPYDGSWLLSIIVGPIGPISTPPTTGYIIIGGIDGGTTVDVTAAYLAIFGQPPTVGQQIFAEVDTLWPGKCYVYTSVYLNTTIGA